MTRRRTTVAAGLALVAGVAIALLIRTPGDAPTAAALQVGSLLGDGDVSGLRLADPSYRPAFPHDHGAHPDFRSEWWYFTGNLDGSGGRRFGFQFTIFRFALGPAAARRSSRWATRQAWMGHLAVTDVDRQRFFSAERIARGGDMGLAGASADPFTAWIGGWRMASAGQPFLPMDLRAASETFGLTLKLQPGPGPVLQGEEGFSRKGPGPGNASHYYSYPRLPVSGELDLAGEVVPVTGEAWLDREWGTSALGPMVRGWDWFALRFDSGGELMYYQLRRADGSADPLSAGTLTDPLRRLEASSVALTPRRYWRSPETGVRYPVAWDMAIPSEDLRLEVEALMDAQEMDLSVTYWEGAVKVTGLRQGVPVAGRGYLEMTGYDADPLSP